MGFRDTVAILTMYKTGIRIQTLGELKERHIDYENPSINLDGSILKNHKFLKLQIVRSYYNTENTNIIITQNGLPINNSKTSNNAISKQLNKYSKRFGLENINAHAIRRGYAKKLLDAGASIAIISKALGYSDLGVTTQYLDLDVKEVATSLRDYQ
nr:site-specific integrase [Paenisporosarcina indica]